VTMHPGQLDVRLGTVRLLVDSQFPQWRSLPIEQVPVAGTMNALFRVGEHHAARFPLAPADVETTRRQLESEAAAARELLGRTRFPTPEPVAIGEPGAGYPLPWSVQTWLPGTTAAYADPGDSVAFAHDLAEFILGVRAIGTDGRTFFGLGRGGTSEITTTVWMSVSGTASTYWTSHTSVDSGQRSGTCRRRPLPTLRPTATSSLATCSSVADALRESSTSADSGQPTRRSTWSAHGTSLKRVRDSHSETI
jgi:hypothetical protein